MCSRLGDLRASRAAVRSGWSVRGPEACAVGCSPPPAGKGKVAKQGTVTVTTSFRQSWLLQSPDCGRAPREPAVSVHVHVRS